jgi:exosome complex component CSL4
MTDTATINTTALPTLRYALDSTVTPGDRLGTLRQVLPGVGTYVKGGHIYASVVGRLTVEHQQDKLVAQVKSNKELASSHVLSVGQIVLGRVVRIATQQAQIDIVALQEVGLLRNPAEGVIRREDVRTGASDQVLMEASFMPGDVVLCRVLSLGDPRRYYLTTAEPALGVMHAVSASSGMPMVPSSWKEMECPETGVKELRKCARPRDVSAALQQED